MLRQLLILSFIVIGGCANAQSKIDILYYHYNIELNDNNDTIKGVAAIGFRANEETSVFSIDLAGMNNEKKGMIVSRVLFTDPRCELIGYKHENDKIIIRTLPIKKGDSTAVFIYYMGIPGDGLIISKNKYGDRTFFADNWPNRGHNWIPCVDDPADKASLEFIVIAPSHYRVISNGIKMEEKELGNGKKLTHWKEDTPLPTKIMVIGVARFAVKQFEDSPANIPVTAWVYPQDSTEGFKNYSPVPAILKFFSAYIGPFPYEKLANVQSKTMFGGMENASAIFYYEESATSKSLENTLAHEVAHQYFGDMATEKSFPHLWLSEGFATQLTHIYIESKYGTDSLNNEMKKDRTEIIAFAKDSDRPVVDSVSPLMQLLNTNSYQKGGWILHMLRRQLSDSVFHKIIRNYYAAFAGKNADTRDFQKICEATSGKDLGTFFDQWLYTPGLPKIEVKWKYDSKKNSFFLTVKQLQQKLFQFPLDIQIQAVSGKSKWETLAVTKQNQQFSIPVKEKPGKLYLDPKISLLFEGSASMTK
ncbi:MAG: M1 family metallopeptidase [Chitinophagales bacterium]